MPRRTWTWALSALALLGMVSISQADLGPENVALVVNADSWASLSVANAFVESRSIPAGNVVFLHLGDLENFERLDVDTFRARILRPVLEQIEQRGLKDQIDCITYSSDLPHTILCQSDMGGKKMPPQLSPVASITGATFFYQQVLAKDPGYVKLDNNPYARRYRTAQPRLDPDEDEKAEFRKARQLTKDKKWEELVALYRGLAEAHPESAELRYQLAGALGREGKIDEGIAELEKAIDAGYWNTRALRVDDVVTELRPDPRFKPLLARVKPLEAETQPATAFHNTGGQILSVMLSATSGRGLSVSEAMSALGRSAAGDGTQPKGGAVYYVSNSNIRAITREWGFQAACKALNAMGVKAEVLDPLIIQGFDGSSPKDKPDVIGAQLGLIFPAWEKSGSTMLPGAIVENLTSEGGILAVNGGQTPLTDFIRHGAAGSCGTVDEPYAIQSKFPTPFLYLYYAQGATLAEAFYLSVGAPYQLLIAGDPLCRPFAPIPLLKVEGAKGGEEVKGQLALTTRAEEKIIRYELFVDGKLQAASSPNQPLKLDTTALSDGHHELSVRAIRDGAMETHARWSVPVTVANRGHRASLRTDKPTANLEEMITLRAEAKGARSIAFLANGQSLGTRDSEMAELQLPAVKLGLGPVRLTAVATIDDQPIVSEPVKIEITPAPPRPATAPVRGPTTQGILVHRADGSARSYDRRLRDLAASVNLQPDQPFTLEGIFDVEQRDVHQVQAWCVGSLAIEVDGKDIGPLAGDQWNMVPLTLDPGPHTLKVSVHPRGPVKFDVRLGGPGSRPLGPDRFRFNPATTQGS